MNEAATGINSIAAGFEKLESDKLEDMTDSLERFIDKLKELSEFTKLSLSDIALNLARTSKLKFDNILSKLSFKLEEPDPDNNVFDTTALTNIANRFEAVTDMFETLIEKLSSDTNEGGLFLPADSNLIAITDAQSATTMGQASNRINTAEAISGPAPVGEVLSQVGNMLSSNSITVVNNNSGGNVTTNSTAQRVTNAAVASPAILSGSAMGAM